MFGSFNFGTVSQTLNFMPKKHEDYDAIERINVKWKVVDFIVSPITTFDKFEQLQCECSGLNFTVLMTAWAEFTARCEACGEYIVICQG